MPAKYWASCASVSMSTVITHQNGTCKCYLFTTPYRRDRHGRTAYKPAPGWPTIAAGDDTAELEEYLRLQARLFEQGEPFSQRGSRRHGPPTLRPSFVPLPVAEEQVVSVIADVMSVVQPCAVTQEQILRAAFFARLPQELAAAIGTVRSGVHPERPTPSSDYRYTGKRKTGMRGRYDLGFGHPVDSKGITAVAELKAGSGSFDHLRSFGRLVDESGEPTEEKKRQEPLIIDILKLLDPNLPQGSIRISWIALGKRGVTTAAEIRERAERVIGLAAWRRNLQPATFKADAETGWLTCEWAEAQVTLRLAWYRPDESGSFEPVFRQ
jgi:hypothetical protein